MKNLIKYQKGFTIIEAIIVIALVTILSAIIIPLFTGGHIPKHSCW